MVSVTSTDQEIVDFIVDGTSPEAVLGFRPSQEASRRLEDLIEREKSGVLTDDERIELDRCFHLEHLMRMAKAKATLMLARAQ